MQEENLSATKIEGLPYLAMLQIQVDHVDPHGKHAGWSKKVKSTHVVKAKLHALPHPSEPHRLSTAPVIQILIARPLLRKPCGLI